MVFCRQWHESIELVVDTLKIKVVDFTMNTVGSRLLLPVHYMVTEETFEPNFIYMNMQRSSSPLSYERFHSSSTIHCILFYVLLSGFRKERVGLSKNYTEKEPEKTNTQM